MPQKSRPDPASGNAVSADEYEGLTLGYGEDGVIGTPSDTSVVFADSTGRQVKVRAGKLAMVRGYVWFSDPTTDEIIANLPANTSGNPRVDRLVLRLDRSARTVRTVYLQGAPAATNPQPPALTQDANLSTGLFDLPLAKWNVANGYTTVAAADVTTEVWYPQPTGPILCTSTSRPFGASLYPGMQIYDTDTGFARYWDASASLWTMVGLYSRTQQLTSSITSITFSGIPTNLRVLKINWTVRGDAAAGNVAIRARINNSASASYKWAQLYSTNGGAPTSVQNLADSSWIVGNFPGANGPAGHFGSGEFDINGWNNATQCAVYVSRSGYADTNGSLNEIHAGSFIVAGPYTSVTLISLTGNFVAGSVFTLTGHE